VEDRNELLKVMRPHLSEGSVLLMMGARDPGLEAFTKSVWDQL
jgi:UDP-N-acetylmuramate--alanine ligase